MTQYRVRYLAALPLSVDTYVYHDVDAATPEGAALAVWDLACGAEIEVYPAGVHVWRDECLYRVDTWSERPGLEDDSYPDGYMGSRTDAGGL